MNENKTNNTNNTINSKRIFAKAMGEDVVLTPEEQEEQSPKDSTELSLGASKIKDKVEVAPQPQSVESAAKLTISTSKSVVKSSMQSKKPKKTSYRWLWMIFVPVLIAAAFVLGLYWPLKTTDTSAIQPRQPVDKNEAPVAQIVESHVAVEVPATDTAKNLEEKDGAEPPGDMTDNNSLPLRLPVSFFQQERLFVACFAMKKEDEVLENIVYMQSKGYRQVHYYWIPDVLVTGNRFFKIVEGPYPSVVEAKKALKDIQQSINQEAYLLKVKAVDSQR